jgi:hypothetical protein
LVGTFPGHQISYVIIADDRMFCLLSISDVTIMHIISDQCQIKCKSTHSFWTVLEQVA